MEVMYSSLADDASTAGKKREAAALLSLAEGQLADEEADAALKTANDAVALFRGMSDMAGAADALRLAFRAHRLQGVVEADIAAAKGELEVFEGKGEKGGAAKMMLSLAELTLGKGADKAKCDEAQRQAENALSAFRSAGDRKMEAAALLTLSAVYLGKSPGGERSDEARRVCDEAVPIFRELGDVGGEGAALHGMACARLKSGATDGALRAAEEALALFQKAKSRKQEARELHWISKVHLQEGDAAEAVSYAGEALDILNDDWRAADVEAEVMETLVRAHLKAAEPAAALKAARDELERFEESGNAWAAARAMEMKILCYQSAGNLERATRSANMALEALEAAGDLAGQANMLRTIAKLHAEFGEYDKALRTSQEALTLYEDMGDVKGQAATLQMRSSVHLAKEEYGKALNTAEEVKELYQEAQEEKDEGFALLHLANVQFAQNDLTHATASASEALAIFRRLVDADGERAALVMVSNIEMKKQDWDAALRTLGRVLPLVREAMEKEEEVRVMVVMVRAQLMLLLENEKNGKGGPKAFKTGIDKVMKTVKEALSIARKTGDEQCVGMAMFQAAQVHVLEGKMQESMKVSASALTKFRDSGDLRSEAATLTLRADCLLWSREIKDARESAEEAVYVCQQIGDADGEDQAWDQLERIERVEDEERQKRLEQQQQMMMMQQQQSVQPLKMVDYSGKGAEEEKAPAAAASGGFQMAKLDKIDVTGGITAEQVSSSIQTIAKGLIGSDEEIELDMPLMEGGLTSNTAVLLRDQLADQLPGIRLPTTLMFDYPSITAVSELVMEEAAKAAKKKLKG